MFIVVRSSDPHSMCAARFEHAHGGAGDGLRDLQQEGEKQVVPPSPSRHPSRGPAQEMIRTDVTCGSPPSAEVWSSVLPSSFGHQPPPL
jgi:hypothetical protein